MKNDHLYFVQYGFNFSHCQEIKTFTLYRDAIKFFNSLDRDLYTSGFIYKASFSDGLIDDKVEYKKFYCEIKNNTRIIEMMKNGSKF
jgi:hypothetical protein